MILIGDCRALVESLDAESVDCIIADPPYGETSLEWDRWPPGWPAAMRRVLKRTGSMWVFGSQRMFWDRRAEFEGWKLAQDVVWEKHNGSGFAADRFKRVHENALHFYRTDASWAEVYKKPQFTMDAAARSIPKRGQTLHTGEIGSEANYRTEEGGPRMTRSVIFVRSEHGRAVHPTQKPIGIVEPLLLYSCPPGGLVLDPFLGSGTTAVVAQRQGMKWLGMEGRPDFAAVAEARIGGDMGLFA